MAELILTEEEKNTPCYLDWDDETLGKAVRSSIAELGLDLKDDSGFQRIFLMSAAVVLIGLSVKSNAADLDIKIEDATVLNKSVGTWLVSVRQLEEGELTKEIAEQTAKEHEEAGTTGTMQRLDFKVEDP